MSPGVMAAACVVTRLAIEKAIFSAKNTFFDKIGGPSIGRLTAFRFVDMCRNRGV
jgi:hypothetical protein